MSEKPPSSFAATAESLVENTLFKGFTRLSMAVCALVGVPLALSIGNRTYDALERLDRSQQKLEAQIERVELRSTIDRDAEAKAVQEVDGRVTILSNRLTKDEVDYSRVSEVQSGFLLRDQHLTVIDHRLDILEGRGVIR